MWNKVAQLKTRGYNRKLLLALLRAGIVSIILLLGVANAGPALAATPIPTPTALGLTLTPTSVLSGSTGPVELKAKLTRATGGAVVPGANIKFEVGPLGGTLSAVGTVVTDANGEAKISNYDPSGLAVGSNTVKASFDGGVIGGTTYTGKSISKTLAVNPVPTTLTLSPFTPSTIGSGYAGPVVISATLNRSNTSPAIPIKDASINFVVSPVAPTPGSPITIGPVATNANGQAILNYDPSGLAIGSYTVKAAFAQSTVNNITYGASTSAARALTIIPMTHPITEITIESPNVVPLGDSFMVTVKEKSDLTGLYLNGLPVTLTITGPAPSTAVRFTNTVSTVAGNGAAFSVPTVQMAPGVYTVSASFAGTPIYAPSNNSISTLLLRRMAVFEIDEAKIDFEKKAGNDKVRVQGRFELALGDKNGVSLTDDVVVTIGQLAETIKMVQKGNNGEKWEYQRLPGATSDIDHMSIDWKNSEFDIRIDGADLASATNPIPVIIQIGYEYGGQTIRMRERGNHWDYHQVLWETIIAGADLHLSREGTYQNGDPTGNSYGPPAVPSITNSWEWVIGSGKTYWNMPGISATGLLAAYEKTKDTRYLVGAKLTGNTLVEKYNTIVTNDPNGAQWQDRPFSQDIEFLARLSQDTGDATYKNVAAAWYGIVIDTKTAVETADRYIDARKSMAGWDLASQIRAAVAAGQVDYARGIVARLIERRAAWEHVKLGNWDYTNDSYASLLWALRVLDDDSFSSYSAEIRAALLASQASDGSWDGGSYQTTAYAILGLELPRNPASSQVIDKAWTFLRDNQNPAGDWSYASTTYSEDNAEVLMALGTLTGDGGGKKLVRVDPKPPAKPKFEPAP